jgi:hypothetical protein
MSTRTEALRRLYAFTQAACGDPVFRRELRYNPQSALSTFHFAWEHDVPDQLPIRHYEISVNFESALLFGPPDGTRNIPRHWQEKTESKLLRTRAKPLLLEHGREEDVACLGAYLRGLGMSAYLSPYEFTPVTESAKAGYSNLSGEQRRALPGSGGWRTLVAGWEGDRVELAWLCLLFGWDEFLGRLLGYPYCCAAAFARLWPEARRSHQGDVAGLMLQASTRAWVGRFGWQANIFGRYRGVEVVQHFPCTWDCPATGRLARRNRKVLETYGTTSDQFSILASPVLYTARDGVVLFPGAKTDEKDGEATLSFDGAAVFATHPAGNVAKQLAASNGRISTRGAVIDAAGDSIQGWLIDFIDSL